jgi:hypothetical protein
MPLPNTGSMDGNTGRSEGATAEKAVPFPCAVRDPNRAFVEVRAGEPRLGARSARHLHSRRQLLVKAAIAALSGWGIALKAASVGVRAAP